MYGHARRIYAAVKFFLYTMIASVFMLAAIIWLYVNTGSFDFTVIREALSSGHLALTPLASLLCSSASRRFCRQSSVVPAAHLAARRARGSSHRRLGSAGCRPSEDGDLRTAAFQHRPLPGRARPPKPGWIAALAIIGIIYGALVAMVQPNPQEADRVLLRQPSWIHRPRQLHVHTGRHRRCDLSDAQPRSFHRRPLHARWHFV